MVENYIQEMGREINTMGSKSITHKNAKISRSDEDELEKKGAVLNVNR
jgi:uncharacterized protein YicC (UPF0701 family)